jgi:2-C-methyl-D-erythritol 4-phosphate cytidylyltransferase
MNIALIVAAGRGYRVGGAIPKQYLELGGCTILRRTILAFQAHPAIGAVQVLIHPDDRGLYDEATEGLALPAPLHGGATRQESVRNGLEGIADLAPAHVLITDAVRPFVTAGLISDVLAALETHPGAIAAVPLADTLKRGAGGLITATVDRANLFRAQTPQGFRYAAILAAHRAAAAAEGPELTDDAMVAERAGLDVVLVAGSEDNFKITTAQDVSRAEAFLRQTNKGVEP